jgi:hypothetical protein
MSKTLPKTIADEMLEDLVFTEAENERMATIAREQKIKALEEIMERERFEALTHEKARRQARKMKKNSEW